MAINTLNTIRKELQQFGDDHAQIQRILFGADDARAQLITVDETFPIVYVAPIDVRITGAMDIHRLRIYVYERLNDDVVDFWENASDTALILRDIRIWWNEYNTGDILINEDPIGQFKTDSELDNLVGYYADFSFEIPSHSRCEIPLNPTPQPVVGCAPVTYNVEFESGAPIASGSEPSGGNIEVIVPNLSIPNTGIYKSGQTIVVLPSDVTRNQEGAGADWHNLDPAAQNANIWGHFKRFTGTTGGYQDEVSGLFFDKDGVQIADYATAFPLGIIVDWSTRDWQYGKVLAYGFDNIVLSGTRLDHSTAFENLTIGTYTNWKLPNVKELFNLLNFGLFHRTAYIPLNNVTSLAAYWWARDSHDTLTGVRVHLGVVVNAVQAGRSLSDLNRGLPVSYLTISGNTLI